MFKYTKIGLATTALLALAATAYAATAMRNDAIPPAEAKVSLQQAIAAAEQAANGKATRAEYEQTKAGWVYDVEVVSQSKVFDVRVDGDKGTVISSAEDKADNDDAHDQQD